MPKTITEKILDDHLVSKEKGAVPGEEIGVRVDQTLVHDASGQMAFQEFETLGIERVKTELSLTYLDHNMVQMGPVNADDHRYLQTVSAKYGVILSRPGNGICHQVHLERFAIPGKILLGADSHTPTCGGLGMIAIGAGGLDIAVAMGGSPFFLTYPQVIKIELTGQLKPWVSAKDVVLKVLEIFGTEGNVGCVLEYGGEGVKKLSVPERATIANMGTECGVTTSVFPSDEITRLFLRAQGREKDWRPIEADKGAEYEKVVEVDLAQVVPKVACPHSPGNIKDVRDLAGLKVDQVCIGSCTNSSYRDLTIVSEILKGKTVHPDVNLALAPGSRQVLLMITRESALEKLLASGVRLQQNSCGFCMGVGQSPRTGGVSLRTINRNFLGRSGTKNAQVYLVSPETAAAAALLGEIIDPRDLGVPYPHVEAVPERFIIDDSLFIPPAERPEEVDIYRGPHMGGVPIGSALPDGLGGEVTIKLGDRITTDHIQPSGSRMMYRANPAKYAEFTFEVVDPSFHDRASKIRDEGKSNIIIAGLGYGQGSSREHAALCPMYLGVRAVVVKSIERIHRANLINFGIIPFTFVREADYDLIKQGDRIEIPDLQRTVREGSKATIINKTQDKTFEGAIMLSQRERETILAGGTLPYVKEKLRSSATED